MIASRTGSRHRRHQTELFLLAMLPILAVPCLLWRLGRTEYVAPLAVVQIVCGIVFGPGGLGAVSPAYYASVIQALNGVAWWAAMGFVWIAGIELDLGQVRRQRRECGITAGLALGVRWPSARPRRRCCWPGARAGSGRRARRGRWSPASAWPVR